jgi:D-3-phosphoglycerate dehydrogenase
VRVVVTVQVFGEIAVERGLPEPVGPNSSSMHPRPTRTLSRARRASGRPHRLLCNAGAHVAEAAARSGCRIISRYGIGVDNTDLEAAARTGITVTNVPVTEPDETASR